MSYPYKHVEDWIRQRLLYQWVAGLLLNVYGDKAARKACEVIIENYLRINF